MKAIKSIDELSSRSLTPEKNNLQKAVITHYLHNLDTEISLQFEDAAKNALLDLIENQYPINISSPIKVEEAFQHLLFEMEGVPFSTPKNHRFKFIDLFA